MAVTITRDDNTVDVRCRAGEDLDAELDGWYLFALDVLVRSLCAVDAWQRSRPMTEEP